MDAIWRLTRKLPLNFKGDTRVVLPPGTFSSYNAQATLHYALWGLLLPVSVHGRVSDIWRSYIMQRLMQDVGLTVGFVSPFVKQVRNAHNYQEDYMSERPLYEKTEALITVLSEWKSQSKKFEIRFVELFVTLYEHGFIEAEDVNVAHRWIQTLKQMDYTFPEIKDSFKLHTMPITTTPNKQTYENTMASTLLHAKATTRDKAPSEKENRINPWAPPDSYCYQQGNDWTACAGDHLLYRPSSKQQLMSRQFMCMYEPFCWKQLDWRKSDPPKWSCPAIRNLRFYDMSYHDTVMSSAATLIEKSINPFSNTTHEVFLCNYKNGRSAINSIHYPYKLCPKTPPRNQLRLNASEYVTDTHFQSVDALIFGFDASMYEDWMHVDKTLILALWHVSDQSKCSKNSSQTSFDQIRTLAFNKTLNHIIGGNTLYHSEYIRHYTGLTPLYLPATLISALGGISWSGGRTEFLINSNTPIPKPPADKNKTIAIVEPTHEGRYELSGLAKYAGVVVVPYSITNGKSVEQYAMNIPMFAPTVEFAKTMINDRTATYDPYCRHLNSTMHPDKHKDSPYEFNPNVRINTNGESAEPDVKFWITFAELYNWPCIAYFASWDEMYALLESADRDAMSSCMKQANKWRHFEEMQNWCWVLQYVSQH